MLPDTSSFSRTQFETENPLEPGFQLSTPNEHVPVPSILKDIDHTAKDWLFHDVPRSSSLGNKSFHCPECSKTFARSTILEDHMRSHRKEKPFKCKICQKPFTRVSDVKRHELTHSDKKYSCVSCGTQFTRQLALRKHTERTHDSDANTTGTHNQTMLICDTSDSEPGTITPTGSRNMVQSMEAHIQSNAKDMIADQQIVTDFSEWLCEEYMPWPLLNENGELWLDSDPLHFLAKEAAVTRAPERIEGHGNILSFDSQLRKCPCSAQYSRVLPFARHLAHHLEEIYLQPHQCPRCDLQFPIPSLQKQHERQCRINARSQPLNKSTSPLKPTKDRDELLWNTMLRKLRDLDLHHGLDINFNTWKWHEGKQGEIIQEVWGLVHVYKERT